MEVVLCASLKTRTLVYRHIEKCLVWADDHIVFVNLFNSHPPVLHLQHSLCLNDLHCKTILFWSCMIIEIQCRDSSKLSKLKLCIYVPRNRYIRIVWSHNILSMAALNIKFTAVRFKCFKCKKGKWIRILKYFDFLSFMSL